jgi:hypothetical protein
MAANSINEIGLPDDLTKKDCQMTTGLPENLTKGLLNDLMKQGCQMI